MSTMICLSSIAFLLFALFSTVAAVSEAIIRCAGLHPQQSMDMDQTLGIWYAVEVIHHYDSSKHNQTPGRTVVDTCPMIHIQRSEVNPQHLRMIWTENAGVIEYNFNIYDLRRPGFWLTLGAQNDYDPSTRPPLPIGNQQLSGGSLLSSTRYRQFAGTVEVTKAVGTHMVLTFCTPGSELYSVILSRDRVLAETEILGVNRMLDNRNLPRLSVKEACKGSASSIFPTAALLFLVLLPHFR